MEELGIDNILSEDEIETLFSDATDSTEIDDGDDNTEDKNEENKKKEDDSTEIDENDLFGQSESVGDKEDIEKKEDSPDEGNGSSPNFYSSITKALVEEGVLQNLDEEDIKNIGDASSLRDAINKQIQNGLNEQQRRIQEALDYGVEPDEIKRYENTISYLDNIKDSDLSAENDNGINIRRQLIFQDLINRGYNEERAKRELKKSFDQGTDIDDAKDALTECRKFFNDKYNDIINEKKEYEAHLEEENKRHADEFRKMIMDSKTVLGGISVNESVRQKIYDNVTNPIYSDKDGNKMTALQKYQNDNKEEFLKTISAIFTLTDGFKDFSALSKQTVASEKKKGLAALENVINNTRRDLSGNIRFASSAESDPDSYFGDFRIDI